MLPSISPSVSLRLDASTVLHCFVSLIPTSKVWRRGVLGQGVVFCQLGCVHRVGKFLRTGRACMPWTWICKLSSWIRKASESQDTSEVSALRSLWGQGHHRCSILQQHEGSQVHLEPVCTGAFATDDGQVRDALRRRTDRGEDRHG